LAGISLEMGVHEVYIMALLANDENDKTLIILLSPIRLGVVKAQKTYFLYYLLELGGEFHYVIPCRPLDRLSHPQ